jgi:6,7-dimethyl-8-ribityllumazine synthase
LIVGLDGYGLRVVGQRPIKTNGDRRRQWPASRIMIVGAVLRDIADELARGALALEAASATWERFAVPGAFEIPTTIRMRPARGRFDVSHSAA